MAMASSVALGCEQVSRLTSPVIELDLLSDTVRSPMCSSDVRLPVTTNPLTGGMCRAHGHETVGHSCLS